MRALILALALASVSACAGAPAPAAVSRLSAANSATQLIAGASVAMAVRTTPGRNGQDALTLMDLTLADGRVLRFEEANHAPADLAAQAPGGPLAQVMGLGEAAAPTLYRARDVGAAGAFCAPSGPALLGVATDASGAVSMVGLKEAFGFETQADGSLAPLPVGPAIVCARLRFTRGG
ncbi:MAG: hypothetical protein AB7L65_07160 [Hyphomonadaceae bacterium]